MSQSNARGGGTNADFLNRAKVARKDEARRGLFRPEEQADSRAFRPQEGTPDHMDQYTLLADTTPGSIRLKDGGLTEEDASSRRRDQVSREEFRDAVLNALLDADFSRDADAYLIHHSPPGVRFVPRSGRMVAATTVDGFEYEGEGEVRSDALRELSAAVSAGPRKAVREIVLKEPREVLKATDQNYGLERISRYFRERNRTVRALGDALPAARLRLSHTDLEMAALLGIPAGRHTDIHSLLKDPRIRSLVTLSNEMNAAYRNPSESIEFNLGRMERAELRRTDRYGPSR